MVANGGERERVDVASTFHSMILYWALCCYTSYVTIYLDLDCLAPFQNYRCRHFYSCPPPTYKGGIRVAGLVFQLLPSLPKLIRGKARIVVCKGPQFLSRVKVRS